MTSAQFPTSVALVLQLPGPDRKRKPAPYLFRVLYRSPDPGEAGCVATWEVLGGREAYQISLENTERHELLWHCTCPDAVYREPYQHKHRCKHIRGLLNGFEAISPPVSA